MYLLGCWVKNNIIIQKDIIIQGQMELNDKEDAKAKDTKNKALNKQELENRRNLSQIKKTKSDKNIENVHLYPHLDHAGFNQQITEKREFYDTQYDGAIVDIVARSNELANVAFELSPHQIFVQNFLSMYTPYNSLLLYHGLGSGKTCSAIGVCEERRTYMRHMNTPLSKMYVVASPSVQENFQLQLFDRAKLRVDKNGNCTYDGCVGNKLIEEINPGSVSFTGSASEIKDHVEKEIFKLIRASYAFMGYEKFSNLIESKVETNANFFNNRLVVIDEIHNIRKQTSTISANLQHMLQMSKNTQLLLLTATPMFNHYTEIVWLINLLNVNDGRGIISIGDVFHDNGDFKKGGKELLVRKMTGYVSYVRGENPYSFPFRIYPNVFAPTHTFPDVPYPRLKPTGAILNHGILHLKPYLTVLGDHQMRTYRRIVDQALINKTPLYSIYNISKCIQCSIIAYPNHKTVLQDVDSEDDSDSEDEDAGMSEDAVKDATNLEADSKGKPIEFNLQKYMDDDFNEEPFKETFDQGFVDKYVSSLPSKQTIKMPTEITNIGESGLKSVMNYTRTSTELGNFDYKPGQPHIFETKYLETYSSKIYAISRMLDTKTKDQVEGIVLIYSKYIFAGIVPMALALEELGFTNASSRGNLMSKKTSRKSSGLKYVMITGTPLLTPDLKIIRKINHADNINGDKIKVVLISDSGSEGIDLQMIRQIHVLDPWFNLNRTEQIIGRGVRNFSHRRLPFEKRNVQIFLHAATLSDRDEEESMDLYQYRLSEKKAIQIGKISRIVKQHSVDCMLNHGQTNFTAENFADQVVDIQLANHAIIRNFRFGDKPFSASCDYLANCDYDCLPKEKHIEINDTTYNIHFSTTNIEKIVKIVKLLMTDRFFYKKKHLVAFINEGAKYQLGTSRSTNARFPIHLIDLALSSILTNKTEIIDKYGRAGTLVNIGEYYLFQPNAINVANLSVQNRSMKLNVNYNVITFDHLGADKNAVDAAVVAEKSVAVKVATVKTTDISRGQDILVNLFREYERIRTYSGMERVGSSHKIAVYFADVIRFLSATIQQNKTKPSTWMKLVVHHMFDVSSVANKIDLMNFMQDPKGLENMDYDIRDRLRESLFYADLTQHIQSKRFPYRKKNYIYFITNPILKKDQIGQIPGTFYQENIPTVGSNNSGGWEAMPDTLYSELTTSKNRHFRVNVANRTVGDQSLAQKIGFIGFHNDKSNVVFKIKNVEKIKKHTQQHTPQHTLKGTNCFQATPQDIMRNLQWIADASDAALYSAKVVEKQSKEWLCILLELSFRRLNELHVKNKVWFVDTAEAVEFQF